GGEGGLGGVGVLRGGHGGVGLGLVGEGGELDVEALLLEGTLEPLDGELRAELDALAERRLTAAQRALRGDLDGALALRVRARGRKQRNGQNGDECQNEVAPVMAHRCPPYSKAQSSVTLVT